MNPKRSITIIILFFLLLLTGCGKSQDVVGSVLQENGDPAHGYRLTLCLEKEVKGTCDFAEGAQYKVTTDVEGKFHFQDVADGIYFILYSPPENRKQLIILKNALGEPIQLEMNNGKGIDLDVLTLFSMLPQ
jgi:hypothetical protein